MDEQLTPPKVSKPFLKQNSPIFKLLVIFILILLLLIPLGMVKSVLSERLKRRDQAMNEITATWGKEQIVVGPVLVIPYRYYFKAWKEQVVRGKAEKIEIVDSAIAHAYFLPATVEIQGELLPKKLYRGIYEAVVYNGTFTLSGTFTPPDFEKLKIRAKDVLWEEAIVTFAITDLRGISGTLTLQWGNHVFPLVPGSKLDGFSSGIHAQLTGVKASPADVPFALTLTLNGSKGIRFSPAGIQNKVTITSSWPDPSFQGAFLPVERKITPQGFEAQWQMSYYGRPYPQQWTDQDSASNLNAQGVGEALFGVDLMSLVDSYRLVERAIKYGVLFIVLIFTAFFLFEVLAALRIHTIQYALVGGALCLFYLGLLSLSEFIPFAFAYITGAGSAALMIALYSIKVLKGGVRTIVIALLLVVIYGFLYVILKMQDYSLLIGTAGLFVALATVMYATRNIDWYTQNDNGYQGPLQKN